MNAATYLYEILVSFAKLPSLKYLACIIASTDDVKLCKLWSYVICVDFQNRGRLADLLNSSPSASFVALTYNIDQQLLIADEVSFKRLIGSVLQAYASATQISEPLLRKGICKFFAIAQENLKGNLPLQSFVATMRKRLTDVPALPQLPPQPMVPVEASILTRNLGISLRFESLRRLFWRLVRHRHQLGRRTVFGIDENVSTSAD